jgi:hypothetical protein
MPRVTSALALHDGVMFRLLVVCLPVGQGHLAKAQGMRDGEDLHPPCEQINDVLALGSPRAFGFYDHA